ncbi:replication-relaxation family protein [Bacillus sp. SCS-151]|uniref:replication-relaxation family protein n=1 Tax=Nanhaiella sioensis TaxID=3115293 RepID=UPI00397E8F44
MQTLKRHQREEAILLSLKKLDYLNRSQLQILHNLGSDRNASRVLKGMDDYLSYFREGENVYYLNKVGREAVDCDKVRKRTLQTQHYIMRNYLYIAHGCPSSWQNEMSLEVKGVVKVIADALFVKDRRYYIIEVDHTQKMLENKSKVERYRKLIEAGVFERKPVFRWITTTEYRRKKLTKLCEGFDAMVFTINEFQ